MQKSLLTGPVVFSYSCAGVVCNGSMRMAHAAELADTKTLAGHLEFLLALVVALARLQALGCSLVRGGHGTVALDVGLGFLVGVRALGVCQGACQQQGGQGQGGEQFFMAILSGAVGNQGWLSRSATSVR